MERGLNVEFGLELYLKQRLVSTGWELCGYLYICEHRLRSSA